jgi:putative pyruvate formate lyase activating enzyme
MKEGLRRDRRIRVDSEGRLEIIDPGWDSVALLRAVDPSFEVRRASLPGFVRPRFRRTTRLAVPLHMTDLLEAPESTLWAAHTEAMSRFRGGERRRGSIPTDLPTLLDLKTALARRLLSPCRLCPRRCAVDRTRGERGACGLGEDAVVAEHFVHIGEEAPVNPSLVLSLGGCGLRCRHCQQADIIDARELAGEPLDAGQWASFKRRGARSLSFVGGNPDESLPAILTFLGTAPSRWNLPVVWNTHGWCEGPVIDLLEGVIDAWLPDWKYASDACGRTCSGISDYPSVVARSVARMDRQGVPVLVRILVLPGHVECCHAPALRAISDLTLQNAIVSVRGQYSPDWQITDGKGPLGRRPTADEVGAVEGLARKLGLVLA